MYKNRRRAFLLRVTASVITSYCIPLDKAVVEVKETLEGGRGSRSRMGSREKERIYEQPNVR